MIHVVSVNVQEYVLMTIRERNLKVKGRGKIWGGFQLNSQTNSSLLNYYFNAENVIIVYNEK